MRQSRKQTDRKTRNELIDKCRRPTHTGKPPFANVDWDYIMSNLSKWPVRKRETSRN